MTKSTRPKPSGMRIELIADEKVHFERKGEEILVGQHATDTDGEYVFVLWQYLDEHEFAMDKDVFNEINEGVDHIYVVDIDSKDLYKFTYQTFAEGEERVYSGDIQKTVARWDCEDVWEKCADNVLIGFYQ